MARTAVHSIQWLERVGDHSLQFFLVALLLTFSAYADDPLDPFSVLDIPRDATYEQARKAYKRLSAQYHPDKAAEPNKAAYTEQFIRICEAFEVLSNPSAKVRTMRFRWQVPNRRATQPPPPKRDNTAQRQAILDDMLHQYEEGKSIREIAASLRFEKNHAGDYTIAANTSDEIHYAAFGEFLSLKVPSYLGTSPSPRDVESLIGSLLNGQLFVGSGLAYGPIYDPLWDYLRDNAESIEELDRLRDKWLGQYALRARRNEGGRPADFEPWKQAYRKHSVSVVDRYVSQRLSFESPIEDLRSSTEDVLPYLSPEEQMNVLRASWQRLRNAIHKKETESTYELAQWKERLTGIEQRARELMTDHPELADKQVAGDTWRNRWSFDTERRCNSTFGRLARSIQKSDSPRSSKDRALILSQ